MNNLEKLHEAVRQIEETTGCRFTTGIGGVFIYPNEDGYLATNMKRIPDHKNGTYTIKFDANIRTMGHSMTAAGVKRLLDEISRTYNLLASLERQEFIYTPDEIDQFTEYIEQRDEQDETQERAESAYVLRAVPAEEAALFYSDESLDAETGCAGHFRIDFGSSGTDFWMTCFPHIGELCTKAFSDEVDQLIERLRKDILKDHHALTEYCRTHPEARLGEGHREDTFGFKTDTADHSHYIRCILTQGDYSAYCYSYQRDQLDEYLAAAEQEHTESEDGGMSQSMM